MFLLNSLTIIVFLFYEYINSIVMEKKIIHGNQYNAYKKKCESKMSKSTCMDNNLDKTVEGFKNVSRAEQKKNPNKFGISKELDPGQMVMCEATKARYIKIISKELSSPMDLGSFQQVEVYDENGKNVALSKDNYINDYKISDGQCIPPGIVGGGGPDGSHILTGKNHGSIPTDECKTICNQDSNCSGFLIENETKSEGLNKCKTYSYPSMTGNGDKGYTCRVRQRRQGDPTATATSITASIGNVYAPINGNTNIDAPYMNNVYATAPTGNQNSEWVLDLKKDINVKKVKIYFNKMLNEMVPQQNALTLQILDKNHNILTTKKVTSELKQSFDIDTTNDSLNCGGPVIKKNIHEFQELEQLETIYNRQLQEYNQSIKNLMENSNMYVHATNSESNKALNSWVRDPKTGKIGYVTSKGVYKELSDLQMGNQIQGKNNCPNNYSQGQNITVKAGEINSLDSSPYDGMIETNLGTIIKGDPMISNQTCSNAGENIYISEPAKASTASYKGCNRSSGSHQDDLGNTTLEGCRQRAEDLGINVFQMGHHDSVTAPCYMGDGSSSTYESSASECPTNAKGQRMGKHVPGRFVEPKHITWTHFLPEWVDPYTTYATYTITGANVSNLGKTYYITDDLKSKLYPDKLTTPLGDSFKYVGNFDSVGNDIVNGTGLSIDQVKAKCIDTPGAAGFVMVNGTYYIKNAKMWPRGLRQTKSNAEMYIRSTSVKNSNSCSNTVNFSSQDVIGGYMNSGDIMSENTQCSLGIISKRDLNLVKIQYDELQKTLKKIHDKINELSKEDKELNNKLLQEYNLLESRLKGYERSYQDILKMNKMSDHNSALYEDSTLQRISYNRHYILWSILALTIAFVTIRNIR
jgi:hypothetical protein